jgi:hypothetical protein
LLLHALLLAASTIILAVGYGYGPIEPLAVLVIFGMLLSGATLLLTRGHPPRIVRTQLRERRQA